MIISASVCAFQVRTQKQKYRGSSSWVESSPGIWGRSFSRHSSGKSWESWKQRTEAQLHFFSSLLSADRLIILQSKSKNFSTNFPAVPVMGKFYANVLFLRLLVFTHRFSIFNTHVTTHSWLTLTWEMNSSTSWGVLLTVDKVESDHKALNQDTHMTNI